MTERQARWLYGRLMGFVLLPPVIVGETTGIGSEARAHPARLTR